MMRLKRNNIVETKLTVGEFDLACGCTNTYLLGVLGGVLIWSKKVNNRGMGLEVNACTLDLAGFSAADLSLCCAGLNYPMNLRNSHMYVHN